MSLFHSILTQLSHRIQKGSDRKTEIAKIISDILMVPISQDMLSIKETTLFIRISPTIKTAVKLKKQILQEQLQKYNITTIE